MTRNRSSPPITIISEQTSLGATQEASQWVVVNVLFVLSVVFAFVAYYAARQVRIDHKKRLPQEAVDEARVRLKQAKQKRREIVSLVIKLTVIIFVVFVISNIMQWAMTVAG